MINAGGTSDVLEEFQANEGQALSHLSFYIIDSHRPINLSNVFENDRVMVFDDGKASLHVAYVRAHAEPSRAPPHILLSGVHRD